jgi:hypothetical protein
MAGLEAGPRHNDINAHRSQYLAARKLWAKAATTPVTKRYSGSNYLIT